MKTIKVAEATELQLDWLVARIEGDELPKDGGKGLDYSTDWACGGPIIYQHDISMIRVYKDYPHSWLATHGEFIYMNADTPLLAAMRCYVVSKLGETAEVPEELG